MAKRVTIIIDDDVHKRLRNLQSKMIRESDGSVSFSRVINELVKKAL